MACVSAAVNNNSRCLDVGNIAVDDFNISSAAITISGDINTVLVVTTRIIHAHTADSATVDNYLSIIADFQHRDMLSVAVVDNNIVAACSDDQITIDIEVRNNQCAFLSIRNIAAVQLEFACECGSITIKGGVDAEMLSIEPAVIISSRDAIGDILGVDIVSTTIYQPIGAIRSYHGSLILDGTLTILRVLIVLIIKAVVLNSILSSVNGNGDAVQRQILIVIAGSGLHHALDVIHTALCACRQIAGEVLDFDRFCVFLFACYNIEVNNIQQALAVLGNSGTRHLTVTSAALVDLSFPLQRQIAVVGNSEALGQIAATRLPEDSCGSISTNYSTSLCEVQRFDMRIALLTNNVHFQIAGHDLVHAGRCRIGKPGERRPNQHDHTHDQSHNAGQ